MRRSPVTLTSACLRMAICLSCDTRRVAGAAQERARRAIRVPVSHDGVPPQDRAGPLAACRTMLASAEYAVSPFANLP